MSNCVLLMMRFCGFILRCVSWIVLRFSFLLMLVMSCVFC